jgi:nitrogen regulatory protein P-II 1
MAYQQVVAMVRNETIDQLLRDLKDSGVRGVSLTPISGFGEYANPFNGRGLVTSTRVELFLPDEQVGDVIDVIMRACSTGMTGDGIVVALPVNSLQRIRLEYQPEAEPDE